MQLRWVVGMLVVSVTVIAGAMAQQDRPTDEIRFNFKGATFEQVIDFFSRETGLPVVWETPPPEGTLDYLSPESYDRAEALRILNIVLQSKGVMLRVSDDMLYLQKLTEMRREDIPTFIGEVPDDVTPDQVVTIVRPLDIALAEPLAAKLQELVAEYGSITALEQQNSLVITETAAQVRRLLQIVAELDREDPDGAIEIFSIRHTTATALMVPLQALMSERVEKYIVNQEGKQVKIEEESLPGLSITADDRTNSIIAKGVQSRIDNLRETIELLDVPALTTGRTIRTITLAMLSPQQAADRLNQVYGRLAEDKRPTVIALDELGAVTIVGDDEAIAEGTALLREIDGADETARTGARSITAVALRHADPEAVISALTSLLNGRQAVATKIVAGPDGRSIVISGTAADVAAVEAVLPAIDRAPRVDREARLLRLSAGDPAGLIAQALALHERQIDPDDAALAVSVELDAAARVATIVGSAAAQERFARTLQLVESATVVERETRQLRLTSARPDRVAGPLATVARQLLTPHDGTEFVEPEITPVDELDLIVVTARPEQFGVLESLVATLDRPDPADYQFRVIPLVGVEHPETLVKRADDAFALIARGYGPDGITAPETRVDTFTGNLIVSGDTEAVGLYERALAEARRLLPPARTGRLVPLRQASAAEVAVPLRALIATTIPADAGRVVPTPEIEVIERTNSLYVVAEPAQHALVERFVAQLDTYEPTTLPPLKLLQVRAADATQLAAMLRERYDARSAQARREAPVEIDADAGTNTLIVTAHEAVFDDIRTLVESINRAGESGAERETMIFPLKRARAVDLAAALGQLYPEPPVPLDRRGRPLPHLREPREVHVSADPATNTLIVEAPTERRPSFEALVDQLDRIELPPSAELRTYRIERGDPARIVTTLNELATRGVLSAPNPDGGHAVQVTIQAEPESRTLIVAGDEVTFEKVEQVLEDLEAVPVRRELRVFEVFGTDPVAMMDRALALYAEQTAEVPDAGEVSVEVDRTASTLFVVADAEAMLRFASILDQLQESIGPAPDVRLTALEYADAAEVVDFLRGLAESELAAVAAGASFRPEFHAIERTNSVLVAARSEQHDVIRALIVSLDRPEERPMPPLRILQLRAADAVNLAAALMRQYDQRPNEERREKPVQISADPQTNALIVAAHPEVVPELQAIVEELNETGRMDAEGREIRIFPLKVARAEELARSIDEMFPQPPMPRDRRGNPMPHLQQPREVVVRADAQTNSLIVDAPIQRMAGFETLVEQLDRQRIADETEVRTFAIVHGDLAAIAATLDELAVAGTLSPAGHDRRVPVTVTTEPVSGTLIVSGPTDIFERVEQVLGELDARRTGPRTTLRFFRLQNARSESVAPMLREILLTRIDEDVPEAGPDATALLNVTSDAKTNTLIISAPAALMPVAEELVRQLDDTTASIGDPVIRVRPLTFADATDIAGALGQALPEMISGLTGEPIDVRLIATPGSNAIIMVGLDQDLDEVDLLIEPLDARPATDAVDVRTFALEHTDAAELAPIVSNLLTDQQASDPRIIMERIRRSRGQVDLSPKIRVEAHDRTNSLIISGPPQTLALAETLLQRLDAADVGGRRTYRTFTPETADAASLATLAADVLRATRSATGRSTLELYPEPRSGAVVVVGTETEVDEAIDLLRAWDDRAIRVPEMDLRVIAVDHSDAEVVGEIVESVLRDRSRWPRPLQAAARAGVPIGEPTVTGDPAGGRLLVSAPASLIPLARQLVGELDTPIGASGTIDVRVFNLHRAGAEEVAEAVRTAMAERTRPGARPVGVAAESSSNSIVVTAAPDELAAVETLIAQLDQGIDADQPQVRSVFLRHARAETVAPLVQQLLAGEDVPVWMRLEAVRRGVAGLMEPGPDVRVAADPRLNAVVISAPPAVLNVAEQMVTQLDVDPDSIDGASTRSVRVLVIENADPIELADSIAALFDDEAGAEPPPTVRVDRGSGAMIVRATDAQFRTIEQIVREIDRATISVSRQMRLIPIDPGKAPAGDVARTIERLLDRGGSGRVEVITVEQLLEEHAPDRVDEPASGSSSLAPMSLPAALSATALGLVQDDGSDESDRDITIAVDEETNSLIVIGSPRAIERIAELAGEIQDQLPAEAGTIRYVELPETVDAQALARLVTDTIGRLTPAGERPGAMRGRVAVLPDAAGSALIVAANDRDFRTIGQLIAALARPPATEEVVVKVYPLTTVTAERAAAGIRDLVTPAAAGGRRPPRGRQAVRIRDLALTLISGDRTIEAVFDPAKMRVASDAASNSLIVMGPADAIAFVDQFVDLIDRAPENTPSTLKLYPLRHAQAADLRTTLRDLFRSRFKSLQGRGGVAGEITPEFAADERTNTLLVTASPEQLAEVDGLLEQLDRAPGDALNPLRMIEVSAALPSQVAMILEQVVIASDQERRASTLIIPDDQSGMLLVRAGETVMPEIDAVLERIDRDAAQGFEVRTITLERADAGSVADALQRFFDDRARIASEGRGRRAQSRRVSIVGDTASATLLIAASDEDYAEIERLVEQFDTAEAVGALSFRVFLLEHSKVDDVESTVQDLVNDLMWNQGPNAFFFGSFLRSRSRAGDRRKGSLAIRGDRRLNALIVTGEGDKFDVVEQLIDVLDAPSPEGAERVVRLYRLRHADLDVVEAVVREVFAGDTNRRWWEPEDPGAVKIRGDSRSNTLIVSGTVREHDEIAELIVSIDSQVAPPDQQVVVLPVRFGAADELARTLEQFLADRAEATNAPEPSATIVANETANALVVSAAGEDLATIRDLLGQLDRADVTGERMVEIIVLREGDADEVARIIKAQFPRGRDSGVIVTPDRRTNSVIVNAPADTYARVEALIRQLDSPPAGDETIIRTYALTAARATDAVKILADSLQLDERGETTGITIRLEESDAAAVEVRARITADRRSNSLIVTATEESFPVIETLIRRIDDVPTVSPVEYRIIPLKHALAIDVAFTLRQFTRQQLDDEGPEPKVDYNRLENHLIVAATADQFDLISKIVEQIDQPSSRERITDFVPLQFAEAEKVQEALGVFYGPLAIEADTPGKINARIVADPATNSLVISADEGEWADIRELLGKLDNEEYDASLQLRVLPLSYADARSVARAINEAFQGSLERRRRPETQQQPQPGGDGDGQRREPVVPTLLVEAEEWVRASAEPQTNSVIVSASRQTIRKIEGIVAQLDVADYAKLPPPQIIPVTTGDPVRLAEALNNLYRQEDEGRGRMAMRIVPDAASNTIIVRAEDEEYRQILALAQAIQQEASSQGVSVHVLQLTSAPAGRIAAAIRDAFEEKAEQTGQPLSIQVDVTGNSLVIASTGPMFEEIRATAAELDRLSPGVGQAVFIIELEHVSPEQAQWIIETIGLEDEGDPQSSSRLVTEPIKVSVVPGRRALVVVANPVDRDTVVGILKAIDVVPVHADAHTRIVPLRHARADALAGILAEVLDPASQQSATALARAVQEQVRRLAVRRDGIDEADLRLDLTQPVRVIADAGLNALVISSTETNVAAIEELIGLFDRLPITESVTVQLFPLENIAADQFERIVRELFSQGKALGRVPGTDLEGVPGGTVGRALLDEIAIAVDERTNTVVVAGKEEAVALVEVLSKRIDTDVATGWVEPRILGLKFADATDLAETLDAILVEGQGDLPQSTPLQRQVARLRMARVRENGGAVLESDIFQPLSRLVIRAEPQLNALILVGTPINLELVSELIVMLDVEAASPSAIVRIYPVEHASASRLAATITRLFDQQVESKAIRPEDRVIVQPDERTNALIVTTSPRSFTVLEHLLTMLDAEIAPDLRAIRRITLTNSSATRIASLIQTLMDARLERLRRVQPETADLERATIVADPRTNSLVVAAGNESFEVIERLAVDLDSATLTDTSLLEVIAIDAGNVERIAETINLIMDRRYADVPGELRTAQKPLVLTDPRSSSLLVAANPEDLNAIRDLVSKLAATPAHPALALRLIQLAEPARAEAFAPRLQRLMRERQQSLGEAGTSIDRVSIEADPVSNSLIVAASEENIETIEGLIEVLAAAEVAEDDREVEVLTLRQSRATDVVDLLEDLYVAETNRLRGADTVRVTPDERLNAVLVNAPPADVRAIRGLVAQLDGARPSAVVEIKYISLTSANSLETVSLIENVLSGRGIGARRGSRQATVLKYLRQIAGESVEEGDEPVDDANLVLDEVQVSAAIRESITLTPDLRTNTIIVSAPAESMGMIEQMIRDLDSSSTGAKRVRIFKLENADAAAMAEILTELFNLRRGNSLYVLRPREDGMSGEIPVPLGAPDGMTPGTMPPVGLSGTELTAVPDERQQLSITIDSRTNSLLVSGTPTYLDLVANVVDELDALDANERETLVYPLNNADALEVAAVITGFIEEEQSKLVETLSLDQIGSASRLLEREVTIVGDQKSNTVLVSASPRYMATVQQLIRELDIDPPQVLIQVLLAEVTLDDAVDWGVDMDFSFGAADATVGGGFGLASVFSTPAGVPNFTVTSTDFNLLINALEAQGRLQILSNPSVIAANNQPARIQIGSEIRVADITTISDGGNQSTTVVPQEIGIIVDVTPAINPDGFVRMLIQPEISELSSETTQITEDLATPVITKRNADTTVTVRDGQTVVIGGLINDRYELRNAKVPFFGDLPVIGPLFRAERQTTRKTEFLIVVTPYVLETPSALDDMTDQEVDRLSLPESVKEQIRRGRIEGTVYDADGNPIWQSRVEDDGE